jgi:hypothetical protein
MSGFGRLLTLLNEAQWLQVSSSPRVRRWDSVSSSDITHVIFLDVQLCLSPSFPCSMAQHSGILLHIINLMSNYQKCI